MPIHIEELASEVTVLGGDFPLSPQQIEQLVSLIERRLDEKRRQSRYLEESTTIRPAAEPPIGMSE